MAHCEVLVGDWLELAAPDPGLQLSHREQHHTLLGVEACLQERRGDREGEGERRERRGGMEGSHARVYRGKR